MNRCRYLYLVYIVQIICLPTTDLLLFTKLEMREINKQVPDLSMPHFLPAPITIIKKPLWEMFPVHLKPWSNLQPEIKYILWSSQNYIYNCDLWIRTICYPLWSCTNAGQTEAWVDMLKIQFVYHRFECKESDFIKDILERSS